MNDSYEYSEPHTKKALLDNIDRGQEMMDKLIARLTPGEMITPGPQGAWSVKDHLAHLSDWRRKVIAQMRGERARVGLGLTAEQVESGDQDAINAVLYQRSRDRALDDVLADFKRSHSEVRAAVEAMPEDDLWRVHSTKSGETYTLAGAIIDNTYGHALEHLGWIETMLKARANGEI